MTVDNIGVDEEGMKEAAPGVGMLHPLAIAAVFVLFLNDHFLKQQFSSWWTGKLSDLAGMLFFPLFLQSGIEWIQYSFGVFTPSKGLLVKCVLATMVVFAAINLSVEIGAAYSFGLGCLQWPWFQLSALFSGDGWVDVRPVHHVVDPTDLLALPACLIPLWVNLNRGDEG